MVLCLGKPPVRFLWCWLLFLFIAVLVMLVVVLHSLLFLWCWLLFFIHYFSTSSLNFPWAIAQFLHSFYTFSPACRRVIRNTFILTFPGPSFTVLPRVLRFWEGIFLPTGFFYLRLFPHIFATICFYQGLPGSRQFFLEVCMTLYWWSSKHRTGPSVCLIHSNPWSWYSEEFVFKPYQILPWITCGKKFSISAPSSFQTLFGCSKHM